MDFHLFFSKWYIFVSVLICCDCQRRAALPISSLSLRQFVRSKTPVPEGRRPNLSDVRIIHYGLNSSVPLSYRLKNIEGLLDDADFHLDRPTVLYAHGYVELTSDESVTTVVKAYLKNAKYNILVLDWSNMAFGSYLISSLSVQPVATETGRALWKLLKVGLSLDGLHLVGHSLGSHLVAMIARELATRNVRVPRLSALDPAYPGFYPGLLGSPMTSDDANFVDVIHTDGGSYGAPDSVGHADFWPNEGKAKQPGCISASIPLSYEDFCSHWRSWAYWAESLTGGKFLSRQCQDYDSFLRGNCADADLVQMGINADNRLRGNFYLRTAAKKPYALAERGAE